MEQHELTILYEDRVILVCRKEAGLPVQSARLGTRSMESLLRTYLKEQGTPFLGIVHRLDQPVEGLLVFAKTSAAAASLQKQLKEGTICKQYLAMVRVTDKADQAGLSGEEVRLTDLLARDPRTNTSRIVTPEELKKDRTDGVKKAELFYRCVSRDEEGCALLKIRLVTGRHHQIRVQLSGAGMPIVGDRKYGLAPDACTGAEGASAKGCERRFPALCAAELSFRHPEDSRKMRFETTPSFL